MKTIEDILTEIVKEGAKFSKIKWSCDELIDYLMAPLRIVEQPEPGFKMRGCEEPCGCTGHCRSLVPFTELDELNNSLYLQKYLQIYIRVQDWCDLNLDENQKECK